MRNLSPWIIPTTIIFLLMGTAAMAIPMNEQQVTTAVETWLKSAIRDGRENARVARLEPHNQAGQTAAYIAHLDGGGYCICGADDVLIPVYFYAPDGSYDPTIPDLQSILAEITGRLAFVQEVRAAGDTRLDQYRDDLIRRQQVWQALSSGQVLDGVVEEKYRDQPDSMVLPLNSSWNQGVPYNQDCPAMPGEMPTLVGCVATAMSQIMYYWQWPPIGTSTHSTEFHYSQSLSWLTTPLAVDPGITGSFWSSRLQWTSQDGGYLQMGGYWEDSIRDAALDNWNTEGFDAALLALFNALDGRWQNHSANFAGTTYNFQLMENQHTAPGTPGALAAAQLCYHAGIAVDMNWGYFGSGTATELAGPAYENYFRYDSDHVFGDLDPNLIINEIQWQRPVHMRGNDAQGAGHSWVVCGYNNFTPYNPYFWMNMGWGVNTIGWFRFDNVPSGYEVNNQHITGIAPAGVVRFIGPFLVANPDGSPANPYSTLGEALIGTPDNGTIIIKAGTSLVWGPGGVIDRPLTIKGESVTIGVP